MKHPVTQRELAVSHLAIMVLIATTAGASASDQSIPIQPGRYAVSAETHMPNIGPPLQTLQRHSLIGCEQSAALQTRNLGPIAKSPLTSCPHLNVRSSQDRLTFDIVCPGPNAAHAFATYRRTPTGFNAQIKMNMGGKNMTIEERQSGRLLGPCPRASKRH